MYVVYPAKLVLALVIVRGFEVENKVFIKAVLSRASTIKGLLFPVRVDTFLDKY